MGLSILGRCPRFSARAPGMKRCHTDTIAEGTDFFPPIHRHIAQKALRVNLSDLAAKGADRPIIVEPSLGRMRARRLAGEFQPPAGVRQKNRYLAAGGDTGAGRLAVTITCLRLCARGAGCKTQRRPCWRRGLCHRLHRRYGGGWPC